MSYSFNIRVATIAAAAMAVASQLDTVIAQQPVHERDRSATENAVADLVSLAREPGEGHELCVSVAGSCYGAEGQPFEGITLNVNITRVAVTT